MKFRNLLPILILLSCNKQVEIANYNNNGSPTKPVLDELNYEPHIVGPNIISKSHFEGHASVAPSGNEIYFAVYSNDHAYSTIAYSTKDSDQSNWKEPKIVSFSGKFSDGSPALSPDGKRLYFSSRRPVSGSWKINSSNDIWYVERTNKDQWCEPIRLNNEINTPFNEFSPSVDINGNLYFCSNRPEGFGDFDVYFAKFVDNKYQKPLLLDSSVNSQYHEGNVGISPDGNMLFIMVQHKPGDFGYDDIHYSIKKEDGWQSTKNIGSIVNTSTYDFSPKVSPDGNTLYFSSRINREYNSKDTAYTYKSFERYLKSPLNGLGNIYKIELNLLDLKNE